MKPFEFYNPVKLIWGEGRIEKINEQIPGDSKVLLVYGGGSVKKNGAYEQVASALKGYEWGESGGIETNPSYEICLDVIQKVRKEKYSFLLALGGGSVIDATKFIALAACLPENTDPWGIMTGDLIPTEALPFGTILTLPATGSEMNANVVISRKKTKEKLVTTIPLIFPRFSVMDPSVTTTLGEKQTANGIVDTFIHVLEQYLTIDEDTLVQDSWSEGILRTLIETGPSLMKDLKNIALRNRLMYCSTMALNGFIAMGCTEDWAAHRIGHELTALFGLDHARSLSVILCSLLRYRKEIKRTKLLKYAQNVWSLDGDKDCIIEKAIIQTEKFFTSMGVPTSLNQAGIPIEAAVLISSRFQDKGVLLGEDQGITPEDVEKIITASL